MRRLLAPLLILLAATPARALTIQARVNRDHVALNDQVLLTVTITLPEATWPRPQLPSVPNFNIHSAGRRNRTNIINNQMSSSAEYDYLLVPRFVGHAVIPPITVSHGGETARTKPINIRVLPADTATPAPAPQPESLPGGERTQRREETPGPDMFITAEVDKKKPYVNEQVVLSVRFYLGVPTLGDAEYEFPETHGFTRESLGTQPPRNVQEKNRGYVLHEIRTALFPVNSGALTIGQTQISAKVQDRVDINTEGPDFFRMFFSQPLVSVKKMTVRSDAINIHVRPLPEKGKPPNYFGAVGQFTIQSQLEPGAAKVGEAVTLSVTIRGRGNIKTLGDLTLPEMESFRVYETLSSLETETDGLGVKGAKTYKTVLVARVTGTLTIPPVPFSYFDPEKQEYVGLQTHSIDLPVSPGKAEPAPVAFQAQGSGAKITRVTTDIRHIKQSIRRSEARRLAAAFAGALALHLIPSTIFVLSAGFSMYRIRLQRDPVRRRFRNAHSRAQGLIERGAASGEASTVLAEALLVYFSDKLNIPATGLTQREVRKHLKEKFPKIPEGHFSQIRLLWEELEIMRFAPKDGRDGDASRRLETDVRVLLEALEEVIGK